MSFLNVKKLFMLSSLVFPIFCSCSKPIESQKVLHNKDKNFQMSKSSRDIYKEKIKELKGFNIKNISFYLEGRKKEYRINLDLSNFNRFKSAIVLYSKPFTCDEKMQESAAESHACGDITFYSEKKKLTIDICDKMFFFDGKRKLKYAFVSDELTKLIIDEIKKIKAQEDVSWIADVLKENIKPKKKTDSKK